MNTRSIMFRRIAAAVALALVGTAQALAQTAPSPGRGELLYVTHCGACHSAQMHWREQKLATTWDTLKVQVRRWQGVAQLGWTESDVEEVARYLNATIYRYPEPARVGALAAQASVAVAARAGGGR
jgi:mono/diheme cytochrome c family protein